jgi:hypothetical protein
MRPRGIEVASHASRRVDTSRLGARASALVSSCRPFGVVLMSTWILRAPFETVPLFADDGVPVSTVSASQAC